MFVLTYLILQLDQNLAEFCKAHDYETRAVVVHHQSKFQMKLVAVIHREKFESSKPENDI